MDMVQGKHMRKEERGRNITFIVSIFSIHHVYRVFRSGMNDKVCLLGHSICQCYGRTTWFEAFFIIL